MPVWNYVRGYVKIQINGLSLEKFLNLAADLGLRFKDAQRVSYACITTYIDARDYKSLLPLLRTLHCSSHILEKQGMPFLARRFKDRWMMAVGCVICVLALWFMSTCIWEIRVTGNETISYEQILEVVQEFAYPGMRLSKLDMDALKTAVEKSDSSITWAGAQLNGTRLTVNIIQGERIILDQDVEQYSDIVASKDARIAQITVLQGRAIVIEGKDVKQGDLLISGTMLETPDMPEHYVKARGSVMGKVWYSGEADVERYSYVSLRTGKTEEVSTIVVGDQRYDMGGSFTHYEAEEVSRTGIYDLYIPLEVITQIRYETVFQKQRMSDTEMKELAEELSWQKAIANIPQDARIIGQTVTFTETENGLRAVTIIETLENIAEQQALDAPQPQAQEEDLQQSTSPDPEQADSEEMDEEVQE